MNNRAGGFPWAVVFSLASLLFAYSGAQAQAVTEWIAHYDGTGPHAVDYGADVALDDDGNSYIAGYTQTDSSLAYNIIIIKYDPYGQELWSDIRPGLEWDPERSAYVALDGYFNVYLLGETALNRSENDTVNNDILLAKYTLDGALQWETRFPNPDSCLLAPYGFEFDAFGNVYISASTSSAGGNVTGRVILIKYGPDGALLWSASFPGISYEHSFRVPFAVTPAGEVYLAAMVGDLDSTLATVIVKYDASGQQIWALRYGYPGSLYDAFFPCRLALDDLGNLFATGKAYAPNGEMLIFTAKFGPGGDRLWTAFFDGYVGPGDDNGLAKPKDMVIDQAGNAIVAGVCFRQNPDSSMGYSYGTVKYNSDGTEVWSAFYSGLCPASINEAVSMTVDRWGSVYVTGGSYDYRNYAMDYATVKYDRWGTEAWTARYAGSNDRTDYGRAVAVNFAGKIVVTGFADEGDQLFGNCNMVTIMYSQELSDADDSEPPLPSRPILLENYPNPFNAQTTISYSLFQPGHVTLSIYNLLGQRVATLVEGVEQAGEHKVVWEAEGLGSGVYFAWLESTGKKQHIKMILLR